MITRHVVFLSLFLTAIQSKSQTIHLTSPDQSMEYSFRLTKKFPVYSVSYNGKKLVHDSPIMLKFTEGGYFYKALSVGKREIRDVNEINAYKQITIPMKERDKLCRHINLVVRVYNDQLAFRYEFPEQNKWHLNAAMPRQTPWQVLLVGGQSEALTETRIVKNLN